LLVLVGLVCAVSVGCVAGDVPAAPADDAQLVEGRGLWTANCVNCHGTDGRGGVGTKLNDGELVRRLPDPDEQLRIVAEGQRAMPAFGEKFSDDELEAVVRYTREIIAETP
jgi:cytochrome c oxidase subunit 2